MNESEWNSLKERVQTTEQKSKMAKIMAISAVGAALGAIVWSLIGYWTLAIGLVLLTILSWSNVVLFTLHKDIAFIIEKIEEIEVKYKKAT